MSPNVLINESAPVAAYSWNKDRSKVAVALNDSQVQILDSRTGNRNATLTEHDMRVTSIDWAKNSGLIVTCGEDRNAYVWHPQKDGTWKPTLVVLRINRAATAVKWSPHENKFAVASGANCISVCHFVEENDWWLSKHVKKNIKSTVTCLDWHPGNTLLAAGTSRFAVHVFAAQVKEVGDKMEPTSPWYPKVPIFGDCLAGVRNLKMGWVHDVAFNKDGTMLAWVSHSSTISILNAQNNQEVSHYKMSELPLLSCIWMNADTIMAAGHGCTPFWFDVDKTGKVKGHGRMEAEAQAKQTTSMNARDIFKHKERYGKQMNEEISSEPTTVHVKQINGLQMFDGDSVSSSSDDGKIVLWRNSLQSKMHGLKV